MINFFLIPFDPLHWRTAKSDLVIDPEQYRKLMEQKWPSAKIYTPPSDATYLLWWEINESEIEVSGGLQKNQQFISVVPGSKVSLLTFILWHREIIPKKFQVFLTWDVSEDRLEVKSDTNEQDIVAFTGMIS